MIKVIAYIHGQPIFETRAIVHDPHTGQFTAQDSVAAAARLKSAKTYQKKADKAEHPARKEAYQASAHAFMASHKAFTTGHKGDVAAAKAAHEHAAKLHYDIGTNRIEHSGSVAGQHMSEGKMHKLQVKLG